MRKARAGGQRIPTPDVEQLLDKINSPWLSEAVAAACPLILSGLPRHQCAQSIVIPQVEHTPQLADVPRKPALPPLQVAHE
jgi:hypothetical protein